MKNLKSLFSLVLAVGLITALSITITSCSEDEPPALTLTALTAGSIDLNGATSATTVPVDAEITATFSTDVNATTATDATVLLTRDFDGSAVAKTISVSGTTVTITPTANLFSGDQYKVTFTTGLTSSGGKTLSAEIVRSFGTPGLGLGSAPQASSQVLYLQFDNSVIDLTGNATNASEKVAYIADRFGNENSAANFRGATEAGNGDLVELSGDKFINASTTFSVWFKTALADYPTEKNKAMFGLEANHGFFMEVGDNLNWIKFATNHKIPTPTDASNVHCFGTAWTDPNQEIAPKIADKWTHLVMTYDATTSIKTIYLDGVEVRQNDLGHNDTQEWNMTDFVLGDKDDGCNTFTAKDTKLALGFFYGKSEDMWGAYSAALNTYKGGMDDFRIWSKALSSEEVTTLFNSEKP